MKTMNPRSLFLSAVIVVSAAALAAADNSCLNCHSKLEGSAGAPARDWKTSIHFENGIACSDCHGGDPNAAEAGDAMNPARGFKGKPTKTGVPDFCGKCHGDIRDNYIQSAHAFALKADLKAPNCVTCHTAHKQQKVTLNLINPQTCGQCHEYDRAARLKEAVSGMEQKLVGLDARQKAIFLEGLDTHSEEDTLKDVSVKAHKLTHVLEIPRILINLNALEPTLHRLDSRIAAKEKTVTDRKALGTGIMGFFLAGAVIAWMTYKRIATH